MHSEDNYVLSSMVSTAEISQDIYFACKEGFITSSQLSALSDESNYTEKLISLFNQWYVTAEPEQQMLVDMCGITHFKEQYDDLVSYSSNKIINRLKKGRSDIDNLLDCLATGNNFLNNQDFPIKHISDIQNNTNFVYILNSSEHRHWRETSQHLFERAKTNTYQNISFEDAFEWLLKNDKEKQQLALQHQKKLENDIEDDWNDDFEENKISLLASTFDLSKNKEISFAKKVIKKGVKTLGRFISNDDIKLFQSDDGFVVEGKLFNYCLRKSYCGIVSHTLNPAMKSIPFDLIVMNKDNVVLANLCAYFENTPIIDQVIATVLHIQSGNEEALLKGGNLFNKRDEFYKDETISKLLNLEPLSENESSTELTLFAHHETLEHDIKTSIEKALPVFFSYEIPLSLKNNFEKIQFDDIINHYYEHKSMHQSIKLLTEVIN